MKKLFITYSVWLAFAAVSPAATTILDTSAPSAKAVVTTSNLTDLAAMDWRDFQTDTVMTNGLGAISTTNQVGTFDVANVGSREWVCFTYSDGDPTAAGNIGLLVATEVGEGGSNSTTQVDIDEGWSYTVAVPAGTWTLHTFVYNRRNDAKIIYDFSDISVTNHYGQGGIGNNAPCQGAGDKALTLEFSVDAPDTLTVSVLNNSEGGSGGGSDLFGLRAAALIPAPSLILLDPEPVLFWGGEEMTLPIGGNGNVHFDEVRGFPHANTNVTDAVETNTAGYTAGSDLFVAYPFQAAGPLMFQGGETNGNYQGPTIYGGELAYGPFTDGFFTNILPGVATNLSVSQGPGVGGRDNVNNNTDNDRIFLRNGANNTTVPGSGLACGILFDTEAGSPASLENVEEVLLDIQNMNAASGKNARVLLTIDSSQYISQDIGWTNAGVKTVSSLQDLDWFAYSPGTVGGVAGVDMRFVTAIGATATNFPGDTVFTQAGYAFDGINTDDFLADETTLTVQRFIVTYPPVAGLGGVAGGGNVILSWPSISNRTYQVLKTDDLLTAGYPTNDLWTVLASNVTATAPQNVFTNGPPSGDAAQEHVRVAVAP